MNQQQHYPHKNRPTKPQKGMDEEMFLQALKWHRSGVRFLKAGFFVDSIHSLLEGFKALEDLLLQQDISLCQHEYHDIRMNLPCHLGQVDFITMPLDDSFENREVLGLTRKNQLFNLVVAMVYNLALAYHLHSNQLHDSETLISMIRQSQNLYSQSRRLHEVYGSDILNLTCLEKNLLHLHHMLHLESQKTPVLSPALQPSPSHLNIFTHAA